MSGPRNSRAEQVAVLHRKASLSSVFPEGSEGHIWKHPEENILGRRTGQCKVPEAGAHWVTVKTSQRGSRRAKGRLAGGDVRGE